MSTNKEHAPLPVRVGEVTVRPSLFKLQILENYFLLNFLGFTDYVGHGTGSIY